jgi:hypothetical protein
VKRDSTISARANNGCMGVGVGSISDGQMLFVLYKDQRYIAICIV